MRAEVAIVGAGPVGLTLALLLARRGIAVAVVEKRAAPWPGPRAVHFDGEAMRVFQAAGVARALAAGTMVGRGMLFKDAEGRVLVDWSRAQEIGETGWHESYRCHQPAVEGVLRRALSRAGVPLLEGVAVEALQQDAQGVTLALSSGARLEAKWCVGADGARSFVREALGIGLEDLGFRQDWLVIDVLLRRPRPDLGDYTIQHCDAERPVTYVRGVGRRRRWEVRLEGARRGTVPEAEVWARLSRWITPQDARIERAAVYAFRSCIAERWRMGRAFLAGDAAHQMPPFMGQGMCCGIRDAGNLAWKLALALRGGMDVLDTYESERAPHLRAFVEMSVALGRLISRTARSGEAPQGRMRSLWPELGPGLGLRDGISGRLGPQVFVGGRRADTLAGHQAYALTRSGRFSGLRAVRDPSGWLAARGLEAAILRPDGYVLDTVPAR